MDQVALGIQEAWLSVSLPPHPLFLIPSQCSSLASLVEEQGFGILWTPRKEAGGFVGTELVSTIYCSLITDHPLTHASLGSQHEPYSCPTENMAVVTIHFLGQLAHN